MIGRWTVLNAVLVVLVLVLALQITFTWREAVPPPRVPAAGPADGSARRPPKARPARVARASEDVALITAGDLFDVSRQAPDAGGTQAVAVEVPPPTGIEVVGIRLIAGDQEAFIRDASQANAQRRVRAGDEVAGYTVQTINPTSVELGNANGQNVTLWLQLAPSAAGGRPGAPRPPVAVAAPRPTSAGRPSTPSAAPAASTAAAQRQQQRMDRLRQRGAGRPNLPAGVQQRRNQLRQKGA